MKPDTRTFYEQAVYRAAERIVSGLDEALELESLARGAALSPFHFHRVFRGMIGETPLELHRRLRLERAAWRLLDGDDPITAIAFDAGYETHETFTRSFRTRYGCSPSEFRRGRIGDVNGGADCERPPQIELAARSGIHFVPGPSGPFTFDFLNGDHAMKTNHDQVMNAEITNRPQLRVAAARHVGPYNRISEAFARLGAIAGPARLMGPETTMIAIYHDDPETTREEDLQSDAAITIPAGAALPKGLTELQIPGGRYARATHVGPYEGLGDAWARFMGEWLPSSGERFGDGVSYEVYRNTPSDTPPDELITDMYIPLA
jgi:AraC family transcriptional regulator